MEKERWVSDPSHSELSFRIRHLMISNVRGAFKDFQVTAETNGNDFTDAHITLTAKVASIGTENEQRDKHLRSADFFDAENFPDLKFISTSMQTSKEGNYVLHGELTLKGITKPVRLDVESGGLISDARHGTKAGFTISGSINRVDWGMSFNRALDTGGVGLGEEVRIFGELQLLKQA